MDKKISINRNSLNQQLRNSHNHHQSSSEERISEEIRENEDKQEPDYELDSQGMREAERAFDMIDVRAEAKEKQDKNIDKKIRSILKNSNVKEILESKKKKRIQFNEEDNKQYIIQNHGRKWNEVLPHPKKGRYQPHEQKILLKSLYQCLTEKNITMDQILYSLSNEEAQKVPRDLHFWSQVCSVLPDRTLVNSYKFMKRILSINNNRGEWSEEEVTKLKQLIEKYGKKWSKISKQMKRTAENIRDKYRSIVNETSSEKIIQMWKFIEIVQFIKLLQKQSKSKLLNDSNYVLILEIDDELSNAEAHDQRQMKELERKKYNSKNFIFHNNLIIHKHLSPQFKELNQQNIPWQKVSDEIKTKTIFDCRNKFLQLMMIESNQFRNRGDCELQIVKFIKQNKYRYESEINWSKWGNRMEISGQQAKNRYFILKRNIEGRGQKSYKELIEMMEVRVGLKK